MKTKRRAVLDPALRVVLNYEIFVFSDPGAMRTFLRNPIRYCGLLTDPVSRARFRPGAKSPSLVHQGRPFYFASDASRSTFAASPDSFAVRRGM